MRISDWSSDVCSSDLHAQLPFRSSRLIGAERQPTSDCPQSYQQDPENALQTLDRDHCPVPHALSDVRTALRKVAERARSEERRVGKECVSTCRLGGSPYHYKKKIRIKHRN